MVNSNVEIELGVIHGRLYELLKHEPMVSEVVESYESLIDALIQQKEALVKLGYSYQLSNDEYSNSNDMFEDVNKSHMIDVLSTENTFENMSGDHPMLRFVDGVRVNDVFR